MYVISFSIFGDNEKYTTGLIRNLNLVNYIYRGWRVIVFHDDSISAELFNKLQEYTFVGTTNIGNRLLGNRPGMLWRFLANDLPLVTRFIVRDTDSRISLREKEAVDEWIDSGKRLHIMRDHPHHGNNITRFEMFGGMWGMKADKSFSMTDAIINSIPEGNLFKRMDDMVFLGENIYSRYKDDMIIHSSIEQNFEGETVRPFPSPMKDCRFVGEIINADESREPQYKLWIGLPEKR